MQVQIYMVLSLLNNFGNVVERTCFERHVVLKDSINICVTREKNSWSLCFWWFTKNSFLEGCSLTIELETILYYLLHLLIRRYVSWMVVIGKTKLPRLLETSVFVFALYHISCAQNNVKSVSYYHIVFIIKYNYFIFYRYSYFSLAWQYILQ